MSGEAPPTARKGSAWEFYTKEKEIGRGNFSVVSLATAKDVKRYGVEKVAVKTCPRGDTQKVDVLRKEWTALNLARGNPAIILAYEYFEDETECSMIIEFAQHGTLMDWLQNHAITERQACRVIEQVLTGVEFIHENGYVHRDIKPHNILVAELKPLTIRIADFGLVKKCGDMFWARQCSAGDMDIMSPDMMGMVEDRQPATTEDYQKSDVYAVGVCLYFLLSGHAPYPAGVDPRKQPDQPWLDPPQVTFPGVSLAGVDTCKRMMAVDANDRPDATEALTTFEWFNFGRTMSSQSGLGMSFTRTGSAGGEGGALEATRDPSGKTGTGGGADGDEVPGPFHGGGEEVMLVRHQTQLLESDFAVQPSNERMVSFETENANQEKRECSSKTNTAGESQQPEAE